MESCRKCWFHCRSSYRCQTQGRLNRISSHRCRRAKQLRKPGRRPLRHRSNGPDCHGAVSCRATWTAGGDHHAGFFRGRRPAISPAAAGAVDEFSVRTHLRQIHPSSATKMSCQPVNHHDVRRMRQPNHSGGSRRDIQIV